MIVEHVPLLALQRRLYDIPRGPDRFQAYLRLMIDWAGEDIRLPLVAMNPMGKDHVPAFLDAVLAFDGEQVAADAVQEAQVQLRDVPGTFRFALVVVDDLLGGWTNRFATEHWHCFDSGRLYERGWVVGMLWTADVPSPQAVRTEVLTTLHRLAYIERHGQARTLREKMAQEGYAMARAGCRTPALDADDLAYTREVIAPHLEATDLRTAVEYLYGDAAGATLGFRPCGMSERAGLALALHDARSKACLA